jgi:outer membrane protein OmpA-like peptidoglycan-associated protein
MAMDFLKHSFCLTDCSRGGGEKKRKFLYLSCTCPKMKTFRSTAGSFLGFLFIVLITNPVAAQDYQTLGKAYYIVVGAFAKSKQSYAEKFTADLKKKGYSKAAYGLDSKRNILLVYIDVYEAYDPSIAEMLATRKRAEFPEAWVRIIKDVAGDVTGNAQPVQQVQDKKPANDVGTPEGESKQEPSFIEVKEPKDSLVQPVAPVVVVPEPKKEPEKKAEPKPDATLVNTGVLFNMYDANNSRFVDGSVEIVDTQRARLIKTYKSSDTVMLPNPNSDTGILSLITDVFGYRKVQHEISFKSPLADTSKHYFDLMEGYFVAHFEMVRYHKGDIATLYHVYFYNDAAIMQPESKYELNKLHDMMKANPNYRIRLHGHTNGNSFGKIISMGPSKDFFSVNATDVKEGTGSSKELSGQRAEVIKEWLVAQGIAAERMEVKAWGGKRMLHDRNSNNARKNVRVEVEVLSE